MTEPNPQKIPAWRLWFWQAAFVTGYFVAFAMRPEWLRWIGIPHYTEIWFLDTYAILASNDALAKGLDVFRSNPLDYFGRPHVYSHWWFVLGKIGLTRADIFWVGFVQVVLFLTAAVVRLRPKTSGELLWYVAVVCAPPLVLAVERANNDLVVFILLAPVVPLLLTENRLFRFGAVLLIAVATGLKFYPAIAAVLLLAGTEPRETRLRVVVAVLILGAVGVDLWPDLTGLRRLMPRADGLMSFSAELLFTSLGVSDGLAKIVGFLIGVLIVLLALRSRIIKDWEIAPADRNAWLSFILGAAILTGCFFTGRNYAYRWVFAIWLAPLLWRLPRDPRVSRAVRKLAGFTAGLLIYVIWSDSVASAFLTAQLKTSADEGWVNRWADYFVLAEQPLLWAFFACLLIFLVRFVTDGVKVFFGRAPRLAQIPS